MLEDEEKAALKTHGIDTTSFSDNDSDSGKSELDFDYDKAKPPPTRVDPKNVNTPNSAKLKSSQTSPDKFAKTVNNKQIISRTDNGIEIKKTHRDSVAVTSARKNNIDGIVFNDADSSKNHLGFNKGITGLRESRDSLRIKKQPAILAINLAKTDNSPYSSAKRCSLTSEEIAKTRRDSLSVSAARRDISISDARKTSLDVYEEKLKSGIKFLKEMQKNVFVASQVEVPILSPKNVATYSSTSSDDAAEIEKFTDLTAETRKIYADIPQAGFRRHGSAYPSRRNEFAETHRENLVSAGIYNNVPSPGRNSTECLIVPERRRNCGPTNILNISGTYFGHESYGAVENASTFVDNRSRRVDCNFLRRICCCCFK